MSWTVVYTKAAQKDAKRIVQSGLKEKVQELLSVLEGDPYKNPPSFEKLVGDLKGLYSRRINFQHRIVYQLLPAQKIVKVIRMWTHYE